MLETLQEAWRARHVLVLGEARSARFLLAALGELGASAALLSPLAGARDLCRAMTRSRVSAVFVPRMQELCVPGEELPASLARLCALLREVREAGVPLSALCTDASVYRALPRPAREDDPYGPSTREGLAMSLFSLCAEGASRGLLGDPVRTLLVRHAPALGGDSPAVSQYARWCDALLAGDLVTVEHPAAQGAFAHPAEIACGVLLLGAACMARAQGGTYNLGLSPACLCANRTAARRLAARFGGKRPLRECESAYAPVQPPDGSAAEALCGALCRLSAEESLDMLLSLREAQRAGGDVDAVVREQVRRALSGE